MSWNVLVISLTLNNEWYLSCTLLQTCVILCHYCQVCGMWYWVTRTFPGRHTPAPRQGRVIICHLWLVFGTKVAGGVWSEMSNLCCSRSVYLAWTQSRALWIDNGLYWFQEKNMLTKLLSENHFSSAINGCNLRYIKFNLLM